MKNVRIFLASFVLLAIASAFITPKSHVQTAKKSHALRTPITVTEELAWTGGDGNGDFVIATSNSTAALRLKNPSDWPAVFQTFGNTTCSGSSKICKVTISYTYDPANGETDPLPKTGTGQPAASIQNVINAIYNNFTPDTSPSTSFGKFAINPFTFTVGSNPIVITLTIVEKS